MKRGSVLDATIAYPAGMTYVDYLQTAHWQRVRRWALAHFGKRCQSPGCWARTGLEVHHLTYARLGDERVGDVTLLCGNCHQRQHGIEPRPRCPVESVATIVPRVMQPITWKGAA